MHAIKRFPAIAKNRQHGAVLIVSLLVLLVLTLLGISSLNGSAMEEKMASNAQTAAGTFQRAESSIREAFFVASANPAVAVSNARAGVAAVDRSDSGITSSSQLVIPASTSSTPLYNSSSGLFIAEGIQIVGKANVNDIRNTNTQGYNVFPLMP